MGGSHKTERPLETAVPEVCPCHSPTDSDCDAGKSPQEPRYCRCRMCCRLRKEERYPQLLCTCSSDGDSAVGAMHHIINMETESQEE